MNLIFDLYFWVAVVFSYLILSATPKKYVGVGFGYISYVVISLLISNSAANVAVLITFCLYVSARIICKKKSKYMFYASLLAMILLLAIYSLILDYGMNSTRNTRIDPVTDIVFQSFLLLGFSYASLRSIDFLRSVKDGAALIHPVSLFGYLFPFYMIVAGPISRYDDYQKGFDAPTKTTSYLTFARIVGMISTGLFFKVVVAESIRIYYWGLNGGLESESYVDTCVLFLYLYFDFAGYSLCALGIGKLLGIPTPVNFNKPFLSESVTQFWERWHMSLGQFVKYNIYIPIQISLVRRFGIKNATKVAFLSTIVGFVFTGLWHQVTINFLVWGCFLGAIVVVEKHFRERKVSISYAFKGRMLVFKRLLSFIYVFGIITVSLHFVIDDIL